MSNLAEKHEPEEQAVPIQAVDPSTRPQTPHFDSKYINEIFPILESGKNKFNWWAFFFGVFWLPYKGMWKEWAQFLLPVAVLSSLVEIIPAMQAGSAGAGLAVAVYLGFKGNHLYYKKYQQHSDKALKKSIGAGIGGVFLYLVVAAFATGFFGAIANNDVSQSTINEKYSGIPQLTFADYKVDFQQYVGKKVILSGFLLATGNMTFFYEEQGSMNFLSGDITRLSRDDQKRVISSCGAGCETSLVVTPANILGTQGFSTLEIVE